MDNRKKFKDLTPEDIQYLTYMYYEQDIKHAEKMSILKDKFGGVTGRTIRRWWKEELKLSETFSKLPKQLREAQDRDVDEDTEIVLITAAQNKTSVNKNFLKNLEAYRDYLTKVKGKKTQIIIAPSRYRNPTSPAESTKSEDWWDDLAVPYLYYGKIQFGDTLISADSRVRPTTSEPLRGYEVLAKDNNLVIPHSKIHFKTLPRLNKRPLRAICTTGFITYKNYSDSRVGDIANEHQSPGFVIVEKKADGVCHIPRNVKATRDGGFIDIMFEVKNGSVSVVRETEGFVWGDIHTRVVDKDILQKTLALCKLISPKKQILHDIMDSSTVNVHEKKDMYIQRQKIIKGEYLIEDEVEESLNMIERIKKDVGADTYVVISNHDDFVQRHIDSENWKNDLHNSATYLKYALIQQTVDLSKYGTIYGYLVKERFGNEVSYVNYGESVDICGYECGSHGDHGINGGKGSYKSFSKLNIKMIHGHQHSPAIHNNVTVVGVTAQLLQYYNRKGLSSWAHAHSVVHSNCKNQLLVFGDDGQISGLVPL